MATIKLSKHEYKPIPEGEYVFIVTEVDYNPTFGKLVLKLMTAEGYSHREFFTFLKGKGQINETALSIFSRLSKIIMQDFDLDEFDPQELVGHYFRATIYHTYQESKTNPDVMNTYAHTRDVESADGFDTEPTVKIELHKAIDDAQDIPFTTEPQSDDKSFDLDALLGN